MTPRLVGSSLLVVGVASWIVGCQQGRFTDDHRYVGNPERPKATSESTRPDNDDPGKPTQADGE